MNAQKKLVAIALFLMLTIAVPLIAVPTASAATMNTFPIIGALPNPVGVGQETLILTGLTKATAWPQVGWTGITVTVTKPDNTVETLPPVTTDTTGMTGIVFVPDMAGNYTLVTNFPEQTVTAEFPGRTPPLGTIMKASKSDLYTLVVTEEPRQFYPAVPLPTEYWTRPINAQFREWLPIAGNWLNVEQYGRRLPPNNDDAPETAHILWTKPLDEGGLVGGVDSYAVDMNAIGYEHGDAYSGKWANPVIINGILYYNEYGTGFFGDTAEQRVSAVDLHTGEKLWSKVLGNNERLSHGQIFYWKTFDMYGAFAYLWTTVGSTWNAYDPLTGRKEYSMTDVPSGTRIIGPMGEILIYTVDLANGWMTLWNSSNVEALYGSTDYTLISPMGFLYAAWYPWGKTVNATGPVTVKPNTPLGRAGYMWNKTIPKGLPGAVDTVLSDVILGGNTESILGNPQPNPVFWALSLKPGEEGRLLFNETWTLPMADVHVDIPGAHPVSSEDGVFVVTVKELRTHYGFSLATGKQIWGPTPAEPYLSTFTNLYLEPWGMAVIAYGKLFTAGMSGVVNAYDIKTGTRLWTYRITDPYTEQLFSENWPAPINFIVDGKVYLFHQEHSANTPVPRGAPAVCLNATTGEVIWRIDGLRLGTRWGGQPIIGDSIIAAFSSYDNQIVTLGKGPSATTVMASPKVSVHGSSVLVEGMVTDISPGTRSAGLAMRFPNGVPAVSDASMSEWMKYVYMQFPRPMDAVGVDVTLSVLDPNNNFYDVGTTTSDATGLYSYAFTPLVSGKYTIIASFAGSGAYYASFAETAINVEEAPAATPPPSPTPAPMTDTYVAGFGIALIVILVAGIVVIVLILRRR